MYSNLNFVIFYVLFYLIATFDQCDTFICFGFFRYWLNVVVSICLSTKILSFYSCVKSILEQYYLDLLIKKNWVYNAFSTKHFIYIYFLKYKNFETQSFIADWNIIPANIGMVVVTSYQKMNLYFVSKKI